MLGRLFEQNNPEAFEAGQFSFESPLIVVGEPFASYAAESFPPRRPFLQGVHQLSRRIFTEFRYDQRATTVATPVDEVFASRRGVCQDFAHLMLSILRTAGIPARYVCGYIETHPPKGTDDKHLIGSTATQAWVEIYVPGQHWVAIDPTNNCWCGPQHVAVSFGGDARDAAPIRGTFKGAGSQSMNVQVDVRRMGAADVQGPRCE